MSQRQLVNYEVYVLEKGRWILHGRYPVDKREHALSEAKELADQKRVEAVRLIKDVYDLETHESEELTIFKAGKSVELDRAPAEPEEKPRRRPPPRRASVDPTPSKPSKGAATGPSGSGAGSGGASAPAKPKPKNRTKTPPPPPRSQAARSVGLIIKILLVIFMAAAVAAVATGAASVFLKEMSQFGFGIRRENYGNTLFGIFILTFLISAGPLAMIFIKREDLSLGGGDADEDEVAKPRLISDTAPSAAQLAKELAAQLPAPTDDVPTDFSEGGPADAHAGALGNVEALLDESEELAEAKWGPKWKPEPEPEPEPEPAPEPEPVSELRFDPGPMTAEPVGLEKQKLDVMRFIGEAVKHIRSSRPQLDNYNKFGIHLFLAGASEAFADERGLGKDLMLRILEDCILALGTKPALAKSFCERFTDYLVEEKYRKMFDAGRASMELFIEGKGQSGEELEEALSTWNRKDTEAVATKKMVTVMFTDIVGSTDFTQEKGDDVAQEMVRTHNTIVGTALTLYNGRQVKHTGDGIMATFPSADSAILAAIEIQRKATSHTKFNPDLPVRLRIGLNTGEPIAEDDDIFGSTVQLAARVCAQCATDSILISHYTRALCKNQAVTFRGIGDIKLKGFKTPLPLFEVIWRTTGSQESDAEPRRSSETKPLETKPTETKTAASV